MNLTDRIKNLPENSGVYLFKNENGEIVYIGKANSLKNRVSSYFIKNYPHSPKVKQMIKQIIDIEYIVTASEVEALLLESRLIKKVKPYFNTQLKDDKSYPFIQITRDNPFPAICLIRKSSKITKKKALYYGPFTDVEATRKVVQKLRNIFKIRNCSQQKFNSGKPCLDYQIELCSAPCAGRIEQDEYLLKVKECTLLLSGRHRVLLKNMKQEMKIAAQLMLYEKAAKIRDTISMIEKVLSQEKASRSYIKRIDSYNKINTAKESLQKGLQELREYLKLPVLPRTIEAYDISNIQGRLAVGSMVSFQYGMPDKKRYKHFKIRYEQGINDCAMMEEVLRRRFGNYQLNKEKLPDLILVDGGKGQLNIAARVLQELNLLISLVSLAEREELLFQHGVKDPILLPGNSDAFFLIQRIRDEAHRFALSYHKKLRSKTIRNSLIDFIPGIGEKRKTLLLTKFKSIEHIRNASLEELKKLPGIGKKSAQKIKDILEARHDFKIQE
ncbi:MAG: excinuclease ABC subunit UvrC [Candidatus Atribacteria bacterium]|nr:excinuclease ABC subunit UvrC [Candidatus Atribacteria bacterium]